MNYQQLFRSLRYLVAIGLMGWVFVLFVEHQRLHDRGCLTESKWAVQNDEIYDRELEVE